ncbi:MAG TPA: molybdenum cofactor biosynthesis protein B [Candidatus Thermoplasmatota archaeon]|nr:molybdenum cofactor biosynthesis protein B [Candidatus Thermoplasmatota archaeon]
MSRSVEEHRKHAEGRSVAFAVVTVSDSRSATTDASGDAIARLAVESGHGVARRTLVRDEAGDIRAAVLDALDDPAVEAVVTTGGTGIAPRDVTLEALLDLFEKRLPGFGEIFRMLSFESVGSAATLTRAEGGIARGKALYVLPGSPAAVDLAMRRLILPEIAHVADLLARRG